LARKSQNKEVQPIIVIKKVKKVTGGHHGGAWKVAYADFVTAMMAFFLLLWLLNVVTDESLQQIAAYFDPAHPRLATTTSGAGGILGGQSVSKKGAMIADRITIDGPRASGAVVQTPNIGEEGQKTDRTEAIEFDDLEIEELEELLRSDEAKRFTEAKDALEKALQENERLKELADQVLIDITPEGLRVQIVDKDGRPMFPIGSSEMFGYTRELMGVVSKVIDPLPNNISLRGHTDSYQYSQGATYTNWELSADRANSSRRVLIEKNIDPGRVDNVMGKADQDHLFKDDPLDARNRRISIILLNETVEQAVKRGAFDKIKENTAPIIIDEQSPAPPYNPFDEFEAPKEGDLDLRDLPREDNRPVGTFKQTPGTVYFP
jgi:chemotaxis protein MotB